jgi:hypothetical protein
LDDTRAHRRILVARSLSAPSGRSSAPPLTTSPVRAASPLDDHKVRLLGGSVDPSPCLRGRLNATPAQDEQPDNGLAVASSRYRFRGPRSRRSAVSSRRVAERFDSLTRQRSISVSQRFIRLSVGRQGDGTIRDSEMKDLTTTSRNAASSLPITRGAEGATRPAVTWGIRDGGGVLLGAEGVAQTVVSSGGFKTMGACLRTSSGAIVIRSCCCRRA